MEGNDRPDRPENAPTPPPEQATPPEQGTPPEQTSPPEQAAPPQQAAPPAPPAPAAAAPPPQQPQRRTGLLVLGIILAVLGGLALIGGGVLAVAHATERDADGFYTTKFHRVSTPTRAFVTDLDVGTGGASWFFHEGRVATLRITATGAKPVFLGIGPADQVSSYLSGASYENVTDFEVDPFKLETDPRVGSAAPPPPTGEGFWAVSASGAGQQSISWNVKDGTWDAVVMNEDGSAGVITNVSVGAKVSIILWIGVGLLVLGAILAVGGGFLIYYGAQTRPVTTPAAA